ncbi:hypothetical protein MVEN_02376600 [Mycena venus]|uniref:Transmembrane protein n=1 Tax=Mycena venus TaxID=2733690 RepID=A0A8H6X2Q6_9AGAR|nr:hypothetical protein MVEN_02376600 [Mycena venus]
MLSGVCYVLVRMRLAILDTGYAPTCFRYAAQLETSAAQMVAAAISAITAVRRAAVLKIPEKKLLSVRLRGGTVSGVFLLASGIFIFFRRRRRNRTQAVPAHDTGILVTPTPAQEKLGSAYSPSQVQAVTLPSSGGAIGGYSQHQVVHPAPSYSTTISPAVPPSLHGPYSQPGGTYAAPALPTTISSTGGTQSTTISSPGDTQSTTISSPGGTQSTTISSPGGTQSTTISSPGGIQSTVGWSS